VAIQLTLLTSTMTKTHATWLSGVGALHTSTTYNTTKFIICIRLSFVVQMDRKSSLSAAATPRTAIDASFEATFAGDISDQLSKFKVIRSVQSFIAIIFKALTNYFLDCLRKKNSWQGPP
jgi:hypothetical protein